MAKLADALQSSVTTTIDLIRHGEPAGGEMYRGTKDDPLSELGWQQMRTVTVQPPAWDQVVSSPLLRCQEFASELANQHSIPLSVQAEFREICFGAWEGQRPAELMVQDPQQIAKFWTNPLRHMPKGGEPFAEFGMRVQNAWGQLLQEHAGQHILLVCHGGVIRVILSHIMGMPLNNAFRWHVPYASVSRVKSYREAIADGHGADSEMQTLVFHAGAL